MLSTDPQTIAHLEKAILFFPRLERTYGVGIACAKLIPDDQKCK